MSELAFNANGDSFEVPATVTGWRVRRMKPRGAPELVYGRDGRPLTIGIEADIDELRDAVGGVGRYRLDPINDDGRTVDNVPAAYVQVVKAERNAGEAAMQSAGARYESDSVVREAMRLNTELARAVVDRFPEMMSAAAELLRAADGAGIPARQPRIGEDAETEDAERAAPGFDLNALVAQVVPMLVMSLSNGKLKMPEVAGVLDWRKATPEAAAAKKLPASATRAADAVADSATVARAQTLELPPIDPQTMAHFVAIQAALKPDEAVLARDVAGSLSPAELRAWFDELSKLSVPQAVQKIRVLIAGNTEAVS
jgi:hypothetical protein